MSRNYVKALEEEINFLRITIQHFNKENIEMKNKIEDLKITLNSDKRMLQEYILQITDKDSTVMKLNNTVEQLKKRLENLQSQQIYTTRKNNRVSTPERDRTESNNTKSRVIGNISIKPNKEEQQRALSVLKPRKIPGDLISNKIDLIKKNQKKKHKPAGNKMLNIKQKQEKIKLELNNIKHKLNLIQNLYLSSVEKLKQGKKQSGMFVLYEQKEDIKNKKLIENELKFNDIFRTNYDEDKEKLILFMDDQNQIWEITPQPHLNENILKEGNFKFLKNLEEVNIYGSDIQTNNENDDKSKDNTYLGDDVDIYLNNSFYNENKKYEDDNYDEFYQESDNDNISEESQDSNVANVGDLKIKFK